MEYFKFKVERGRNFVKRVDRGNAHVDVVEDNIKLIK